ncbi:MAG: pyruvate kinase [Candidatus Krumholzibacteria bacterium]|nr:pyruvate kinase [Candidatus Krumholzibacteria bacterium]
MERRAKIVCTIGPACRGRQALGKLIAAGMDVARLNFSHGTRAEHRDVFETLRRLKGDIAIMQDLAGPKIRIGEMKDGQAALREGEAFVLTTEAVSGDAGRAHVTYDSLPARVRPGDDLYLADGIIHLKVEKIRGRRILCRIVHGGTLTSRKGLNVPRLRIGGGLNAKDRGDLDFGLALGVDYVAVSFVRSAADVMRVKRIIAGRKSSALVVAKIEKPEALDNIDRIIDVSDAVMVARGDLGVEIPLERVPAAQKRIIDKCRTEGKPVIVATQMLESMVRSERPTRAEASDVANATLDGADALMLSEETAVGLYPVESVRTMARVIEEAEHYGERHARERSCAGRASSMDTVDAVCSAAVETARYAGAHTIGCLTHTGTTARLIARCRPPAVRIVALTSDPAVMRRIRLVWGVQAILVDRIEPGDEVFAAAKARLRAAGIRGRVVLTAGIPVSKKGSTNTVHVVSI